MSQENPFPRGAEEDLRHQVVELKRYIDRLEGEREADRRKHKVEKTELNQKLALAEENLVRDREKHGVEKEKLKEECRQLAEEKAKVKAEKT